MKRLDRYLVWNTLKYFLMTQAAGVSLSLIIEFFQNMDIFTKSSRHLGYGLLYVTLKLPFYFNMILPLAFLISMLVLFVMMIRGNEMIAVRTSGISTFKLMRPLLGLGTFLVIFSFIIAEWVIPVSSNAGEYIYQIKIREREHSVFFKNDGIWFKRDNLICNIDYFDNKRDAIKGFTALELSNTYAVVRRIDAEAGIWQKDTGTWLFVNAIERRFDKGNVTFRKNHPTIPGIITDHPSVFKVVQKNPEEMGYRELSKYIKKLQQNGLDVRRYFVDLYNKIAFPFINLIMVFASFSVGLRYAKTKHIAKGILTGITIGALYWVFHNISLSFGYSYIFPPLFAAWFTNLIFFSAGIVGVVSLRT